MMRSYAIFTIRADGILDSWNDGVQVLLGYEEHEFVGRPASMIFTQEQRVAGIHESEMRAALQTGEAKDNRWHVRKDGGLLWASGVMNPVVDEDDELLGFVKVLRDETAARRAEIRLERKVREQVAIAELGAFALETRHLGPLLDRATRLVAQTLDVEHVRVLEHDAESGRLILRSAAGGPGEEALPEGAEYRAEERMMARLNGGGLGRADDEDADDAWIETEDVVRDRGRKSGLAARIRGRGRPFGLIEVLSDHDDAFVDNDANFLRSIAHIVAGVVEQIRLTEELEHRAEHDDLTGLPNRTVFENRLSEALQQASRSGAKVAILFLDLDRFKNINDSLGHEAGDEILKNVAARLREAVRTWDTVARIGGDEFVLLLPNVPDQGEVAHVSERLLAAFDRPFTVVDREVRVHTTIGISVFPDDGGDVSALLRAADTAMYDGKTSHRSTFHFYTTAQNEAVTERLRLENDLRKAYEDEQFEVDYQPQIDIATGRCAAVEGLLRWNHPERGAVAPDSFLSVAEDMGMIVPIGEWTMAQAFRQRAAWAHELRSPPRVAVNIATPHFMQPSFPHDLASIARDAGIAPNDVDVEITEEPLLHDPDLVDRHVSELKALGASVTLDDFGTGYSSLMYLRTLPIDRLKIDESFTHELDAPDETVRSYMEAVVRLASRLGMTVVVEGVETAGQLAAARDLGCDLAQGHHLAKPASAARVLAFLRALEDRSAAEGGPRGT